MILVAIVLAVGIAGLFYARNLQFTEPEGALVYPAPDDFFWARQFRFNPLGALLTIAVGGIALVGAVTRQRAVTLVAAASSFLAAVFMVIDLRGGEPLLAGRGGNVSLLLVLALGLAALELTPSVPPAPAAGVA